MIEWNLVAEKEGFVGGHRLDHLGGERIGASFYFPNQFGDSRQADPSRQRDQPTFDQVLLVRGQVEARALLQQLTQKLIVQRCHDRSPENTRTSFPAI